MNALLRTIKQYRDLLGSMSASGKGLIVVTTLLLVGGFGWLLLNGRSSSEKALSWGKTFTTEELIHAEQTLISAGLTNFRREGQRIMVPEREAERYDAALVEGGGLPADAASEWEKKFDKANVFTGSDQLQAMKEIALAKELRRVLRAVPAIEDATVIWARSKPRLFRSQASKVTATVNIRPKPGREVTQTLVHSLRAAVANMVPDLHPSDVAVFDISTGTSHIADQDGDPFDGKLVARIREFTQLYQQKISKALSFIPNVVVTVNVDLENLKSSVERVQTLDPKKSGTSFESEQSVTRTSRQQPTRAEPGAASNRPRSLNTDAEATKYQQTSETNTSRANVHSYRTEEREYLAAMPKSVQVSVSIPNEYMEAVALRQGHKRGESDDDRKRFQAAVDAVEKDLKSKVQSIVQRNIPSGSNADAISVGTFVGVDSETAPAKATLMEKAGTAVTQWGSALGLAIFALLSFWMLRKTTPSLPAEPAVAASSANRNEVAEQKAAEKPMPASRREEVQLLVRDDPESAASVLRKWLQPSK